MSNKNEGQISYAREEGMEAGREDGYEEGIEYNIPYNIPISMDKGYILILILENKALEVIKNMLKECVDYNFISKITGKTTGEVIHIEKGMLISNL